MAIHHGITTLRPDDEFRESVQPTALGFVAVIHVDEDVSIHGRDADQLDALAETIKTASRKLRNVQANTAAA